MNNTNSKLRGLFSRLSAYAAKSDMLSKHGAVLIKNGAPMAFSYNKIVGTKTMHAECDVIRRYLLSRGIRCFEKEACILRGLTQ
jgi:hypothetical protein